MSVKVNGPGLLLVAVGVRSIPVRVAIPVYPPRMKLHYAMHSNFLWSICIEIAENEFSIVFFYLDALWGIPNGDLCNVTNIHKPPHGTIH
jgi:hypothetical protein